MARQLLGGEVVKTKVTNLERDTDLDGLADVLMTRVFGGAPGLPPGVATVAGVAEQVLAKTGVAERVFTAADRAAYMAKLELRTRNRLLWDAKIIRENFGVVMKDPLATLHLIPH